MSEKKHKVPTKAKLTLPIERKCTVQSPIQRSFINSFKNKT